MKTDENNFAYIDAANLYNGLEKLGWKMDYNRFLIWLAEKYSVKKAYLFIGLIPKYKDLYTKLQEQGFTLVYKEVVYDNNGKAKGNCDADLVLKCMEDLYENSFDKALLISSDGDYSSLVKLINEKQKFHSILSPADEKRCSVLLKRTGVPIVYINDKRSILETLSTTV